MADTLEEIARRTLIRLTMAESDLAACHPNDKRKREMLQREIDQERKNLAHVNEGLRAASGQSE